MTLGFWLICVLRCYSSTKSFIDRFERITLRWFHCNAPDTTFHIRNSNSCLFRRCDMIFLSWLGFCRLFCILFLLCISSHSIMCIASICFHKTCIRSGSTGSLRCPFRVRTHSHAPTAPPKYYFISGIKIFSEWVATCRAV